MLEQIPDLDVFLKALASETRQKILFQVFGAGQRRTVGAVAQAMALGQSTASEHLAILKRGGLLQAHRDGKEVYYQPDRQRIVALLQQLTERLSCCCPLE